MASPPPAGPASGLPAAPWPAAVEGKYCTITEILRFEAFVGSSGWRNWRSAKPRTWPTWPVRRPLASMILSSVLKGYISKVDTDKQELKVDVGIFEPKIIQATVPLAYLQAQLADGRKVDLKKISEVYGFHANLPLSIKAICLNGEEDKLLQAELSTAQIEKIRLWQQSLLDRLIVLGSSIGEIEKVLERTRLNRDVIGTEALGLFEHALTCKLGTDATGLIPKIGRYMKNSTFVIFSPKKVRGFIGESSLNL